MSSLKMTFSLASLVVLLAFGLVFAPTSVMAHPIITDATADPVLYDNTHVKDHAAHAVVKSLTLMGDAADGYVGGDSFV